MRLAKYLHQKKKRARRSICEEYDFFIVNPHLISRVDLNYLFRIEWPTSRVKSQHMPHNLHVLAASDQTCIILPQPFHIDFTLQTIWSVLMSDSKLSASILWGEVKGQYVPHNLHIPTASREYFFKKIPIIHKEVILKYQSPWKI